MKSLLRYFFPSLNQQPKPRKNSPLDNLGQEKMMQIMRQMNQIMENQQRFLQPGYNIGLFAAELKVPSYQLSAILNQKIGINFNDYLNRYRIRYCIDMINEGTSSNFNLKGISAKCGFHNRNTFTAAFKKFTGRTPSEYNRHQLKKDDTWFRNELPMEILSNNGKAVTG